MTGRPRFRTLGVDRSESSVEIAGVQRTMDGQYRVVYFVPGGRRRFALAETLETVDAFVLETWAKATEALLGYRPPWYPKP